MLVTHQPVTNRYYIRRLDQATRHFVCLLELSETEAESVARQIRNLLDYGRKLEVPNGPR